MRRDAARLNLRYVEGPVIELTVRHREELLSASMTVATADERSTLFLEFQSAGVTFHQTLKKQAFGEGSFPSSKIRTGICCCLQDPRTRSHQGEELLIEHLSRTTREHLSKSQIKRLGPGQRGNRGM